MIINLFMCVYFVFIRDIGFFLSLPIQKVLFPYLILVCHNKKGGTFSVNRFSINRILSSKSWRNLGSVLYTGKVEATGQFDPCLFRDMYIQIYIDICRLMYTNFRSIHIQGDLQGMS